MDGARFANAIASLGCQPADVTWRAGIDVLSFGGVKNGLGIGEAVVFFDTALADEFGWRIKQGGQLNSKMRLVAAPWIALIDNGLWLANARHANAMARRLKGRLEGLPGIRIMHPVEASAVFAEIPAACTGKAARQGLALLHFPGRDRLPPDVRLGYTTRDGGSFRRRHRCLRQGRASLRPSQASGRPSMISNAAAITRPPSACRV